MKAQIPMPRIAIIPSGTPNAFATGKNPSNATVAVTKGLQRMLGDEELEGVIAHEMAHIRSRDTLVMTTAATIAGAISYAARVAWFSMMFGRRGRGTNPLILLAAVVTAPIAALLLQLAISRTREYHADRVGALTTGKPWALARALEGLEQGNRRPIQGNPATGSLFIINPFRGGFARLFSTHPPTQERVKRLRALSQEMGFIVK
jgi:heat shock protein HtpX